MRLFPLFWRPGGVEIGTGLLKIGNSSLRILQGLFQNGE